MNAEATRDLWAWFAKHATDLSCVSSATDPLLDTLLERLHGVNPGLFFEVCANSRPRQLIVTAGGRRELFSIVTELVKAAPPIDDWVVIALKPPAGADFRTDYEGTRLVARLLWFLPLESASQPHLLGIRVGVPAFDAARARASRAAVCAIIDSVLGERAAATEVQHVEVAALPSDPERDGYMALSELPSYVEWRRRKRSGLPK